MLRLNILFLFLRSNQRPGNNIILLSLAIIANENVKMKYNHFCLKKEIKLSKIKKTVMVYRNYK